MKAAYRIELKQLSEVKYMVSDVEISLLYLGYVERASIIRR